MKNIREIGKRIQLLNYISKTLTSVESTSVNKRMILQHRLVEVEEALSLTVQILFNLKKNRQLPALITKKCFIIIGSDGSLCGAYNNQIIQGSKILFQELITQYEEGKISHLKEINFIIIGKKIHKIQAEINKLKEKTPKIEIKKQLLEIKNITKDDWNFHEILKNYGNGLSFLFNQKDGINTLSLEDLREKFHKTIMSNQEDYGEKLFLEGEKKTIILNMESFFHSYCFVYVLSRAQMQEMISRLYFLKNAIDNCKNEITINTQHYRLMRQEIITQEINELIGGSL